MTLTTVCKDRKKAILFRILTLTLAIALALPCLFGCGDKEPDETPAESTPTDVPADAEPKKRVAITFDDGPQYANNEETKRIVDELAKYGFTATFFVVGNRIAGGDALKYAVDNGNEIGIHAFTHDHYYDTCEDEVYKNEIDNTLKEIHKQLPDYQVKLMRPVGGRITPERAAASTYAIIQWSVDSDDWNNKFAPGDTDEDTERKINQTVSNVMDSVKDGDIILMHDIWSYTFEATVRLLKALDEAGYEVVSVSELLGDSLEAGVEYYSLNEIKDHRQ